jgi:hypothetical protein
MESFPSPPAIESRPVPPTRVLGLRIGVNPRPPLFRSMKSFPPLPKTRMPETNAWSIVPTKFPPVSIGTNWLVTWSKTAAVHAGGDRIPPFLEPLDVQAHTILGRPPTQAGEEVAENNAGHGMPQTGSGRWAVRD